MFKPFEAGGVTYEEIRTIYALCFIATLISVALGMIAVMVGVL